MRRFIIWALILVLPLSMVACTKNSDTPKTSQGAPSSNPNIATERLGYEGGNIGAGGLVCGNEDGYIYYRAEEDWSLYKKKPDGTGKVNLSKRVIENINVLDGWVYFLDHGENNAIYKIRTNGTEETKLVDGFCADLYVTENGMYFDKRDNVNTPQVFRADLNGDNLGKLVADMSVAYYYKGKVYYQNTKLLGVYDVATEKKETLVQQYTYNVSVDDSGIYYCLPDLGGFYCMTHNGVEKQLLPSGDFFNYSNGNVYYMGIGENKNGACHVVNCLNIANEKTTKLLEEANEYFNQTTGEWLGVTFKQLNEAPETIDPSKVKYNEQGEMDIKEGVSESVNYVYTVGEQKYMRASLREAVLRKGKVECIARLDAGLEVWD